MYAEIFVFLLLVAAITIVLLPKTYVTEQVDRVSQEMYTEDDEPHTNDREIILDHGLYSYGVKVGDELDYIVGPHDIYNSDGESMMYEMEIQPTTPFHGDIGETNHLTSNVVEGYANVSTQTAHTQSVITPKLETNHLSSSIVAKKLDVRAIDTNKTVLEDGATKAQVTECDHASVEQCTFVNKFVEAKTYFIPEIVYDNKELNLDNSLSGFSFVFNEDTTKVNLPTPEPGIYFRLNGVHYAGDNHVWIKK